MDYRTRFDTWKFYGLKLSWNSIVEHTSSAASEILANMLYRILRSLTRAYLNTQHGKQTTRKATLRVLLLFSGRSLDDNR
ncbi:hypothetical protein Plhal304r1_c012g0045371 [Plasmopara halstedii]